MILAPQVHGLSRRAVTQRALREVVVVELGVAFERGLQILARAEVRGRQDVADAPIEALDHAVGLRVTRLGEPVLDAEQGALTIEGVLARGFLALGGEAVGELAAVVGQQLDDLHRCGRVQAAQEVAAAGLALVGVDAQENPAGGAVDGDEQVAPGALVGHLWQVLDVHVHEARRVILEGLAHDRRVLVLHRAPVQAVARQAAHQAGARHRRVEEFTHHHQQVVQRQPQGATDLHRHRLLGRGQRAVQGLRAVRAVRRRITLAPLAHRGRRQAVAARQFGIAQGLIGSTQLGAYARRGAGQWM